MNPMSASVAARLRYTRFVTGAGVVLLSGVASGFADRTPVTGRAPFSASSSALGHIEGSVFDSLSMTPVSHAEIWVSGTALKATTDNAGKFRLDSVPLGVHDISASAATFDSAGFGSLEAQVAVRDDSVAVVQFASPSLRTLWTVMCAKQKGAAKDSAIIYGLIVDGDNKIRLGNAPVQFSWYSFSAALKQYNLAPSRLQAATDSTGMFYACGLPANVQMFIRAYGDKAASGEIDYDVGARRLTRLNFLVTKDLASTANTHGRGILRGQVRDANNRPVAEAVVGILSSDTTARTDSSGSFELRRIPAGTQSVQVRKVGLASSNQMVELRPDEPAQVSVTMNAATALATVNVRADAPPSVQHEQFDDRRKLGLGTAIEFEKRNFSDIFSPLMANGRISIKRDRTGTPTVLMKNGLRDCSPRLYLDGGLISEEFLMNMRPEDFKVVEIFASAMNLPPQFMGSALGKAAQQNPTACGAIAYWTKKAW